MDREWIRTFDYNWVSREDAVKRFGDEGKEGAFILTRKNNMQPSPQIFPQESKNVSEVKSKDQKTFKPYRFTIAKDASKAAIDAIAKA